MNDKAYLNLIELIKRFNTANECLEIAIEKADESDILKYDQVVTYSLESILAFTPSSANETSVLASFLLDNITPKEHQTELSILVTDKIRGLVKRPYFIDPTD